jgi:hypothetical protein
MPLRTAITLSAKWCNIASHTVKPRKVVALEFTPLCHDPTECDTDDEDLLTPYERLRNLRDDVELHAFQPEEWFGRSYKGFSLPPRQGFYALWSD